MTSGIVSALDRTIDVPGENSQAALLINAIQTDAAINPGNSAGALVNCAGQFVGMPSAGTSVPSPSGESNGGNIGLGFAIPADFAIQEANEIISTGRVTCAYVGFQATPVAASAATVNGTARASWSPASIPAVRLRRRGVVGCPVGALVPVSDEFGGRVQQDGGLQFAGVHVLVVGGGQAAFAAGVMSAPSRIPILRPVLTHLAPEVTGLH